MNAYSGFYGQAHLGGIYPPSPDYGNWKNMHRCFCRWHDKDVWEGLLEELISEPDFEWLMIDASHINIHPHASGAEYTLSFGTCTCTPTPRGLPSSLMQHGCSGDLPSLVRAFVAHSHQ
ncbi:transposase [Photorhabdus bodei]|uniref:Transposase n=1 Tax=Photorhabdus bodei TaxID=2029681 RepID=A0ABX0AWP5_9GAMM|nr:transposase [Photorhabdus bodei]NDL04980.1 transposase [Photorhabdus bodei]NDL09313.1 transposase [Photorhabdus bodei]